MSLLLCNNRKIAMLHKRLHCLHTKERIGVGGGGEEPQKKLQHTEEM